MPELPEVETIRRQLAPHLEGRAIVAVEILDPRWTRPLAPRLVRDGLRGRVVERVGRSGKYLVWALTGERYLLIHLRMTGALLFDAAPEPPHTRVRFELDGGHRLLYIDPRRFGTGHLLHGSAARDLYFAQRIGVEPMTPEFTAEHLRAMVQGRRAPIKSFVLDQRRIAGIGNIYADEALWRARLHWARSTAALTRPQVVRVVEAVRDVLSEAMDAGGTSFDSMYVNVNGESGYFGRSLAVYGRAGQPCDRCGTPIRRDPFMNRSAYSCPRCQPRPRVRIEGP